MSFEPPDIRQLTAEDVGALLAEYGEVYRLTLLPDLHQEIYEGLAAAGRLEPGRDPQRLLAEAGGVVKGKASTLRGVLTRLGQEARVEEIERTARADVQEPAVRRSLEERARAHVARAHVRGSAEAREG
jgi:hypothetical protein